MWNFTLHSTHCQTFLICLLLYSGDCLNRRNIVIVFISQVRLQELLKYPSHTKTKNVKVTIRQLLPGPGNDYRYHLNYFLHANKNSDDFISYLRFIVCAGLWNVFVWTPAVDNINCYEGSSDPISTISSPISPDHWPPPEIRNFYNDTFGEP